MTRSVTGAVATAIAQPNVGLVLLLEMLLDSGTLRVCSAGYDLIQGGNTWSGVGQLGTVEEVREGEGGEVSGLAFVLSGVPSALLASALGEQYQRRAVNLYVAFLDLPTHAILADPVLEWSGLIDQMTLADEGEVSTIRVTAENELYDFARPLPLYWTDEDQQRLYPGDTGLRFARQLSERPLVWPAAAFFTK